MSTTRSIPIKYTRDYSLFEMEPCNRDLSADRTLEQSFRQHGYLPEYPMICSANGNGTLHVHAGHHRLDLAQRYDTGVWYVVVEPKLSIFERESSSHSHWSVKDFITAYAKAGNEQYLRLLMFAKDHGLPITAAASLLWGESGNSANANLRIKDGTFRVRDLEFAEAVVAVTDDLYALGVSFATTRSFVGAVSQLIRLKDFDAARFVHRASLYPANLHKRASMPEYLEEIEAFYNYGTRMDQRVPLAFLAKAAASQRSPVKR